MHKLCHVERKWKVPLSPVGVTVPEWCCQRLLALRIKPSSPDILLQSALPGIGAPHPGHWVTCSGSVSPHTSGRRDHNDPCDEDEARLCSISLPPAFQSSLGVSGGSLFANPRESSLTSWKRRPKGATEQARSELVFLTKALKVSRFHKSSDSGRDSGNVYM